MVPSLMNLSTVEVSVPMGWRPLRVADGYRVVVASPEGDRTSSVVRVKRGALVQ